VANLTKIAWQARARWKLLAPIFKHDWTIDDYPVLTSLRPAAESPTGSRLKPIPWTARAFNCAGMSGGGDTELEALDELCRSFERYKQTKQKLLRPGAKAPIEFAASDRLARHAELQEDFVRCVFEVPWAWISDESSLSDFHIEETNAHLVEKIDRIYGVDASDISDGNLAEIFDRIESS
jgi:hypothetical protein